MLSLASQDLFLKNSTPCSCPPVLHPPRLQPGWQHHPVGVLARIVLAWRGRLLHCQEFCQLEYVHHGNRCVLLQIFFESQLLNIHQPTAAHSALSPTFLMKLTSSSNPHSHDDTQPSQHKGGRADRWMGDIPLSSVMCFLATDQPLALFFPDVWVNSSKYSLEVPFLSPS